MKSLLCAALFSAAAIRAGTLQPLWNFLGPDLVNERIAIGADGTIYGTFAPNPAYPGQTSTGEAFALNPDGSKKWKLDVPNVGMNGPVLAPDGTVYVSTLSYNDPPVTLMALKDGVVQWQLSLIGPGRDGLLTRPGCPALDADGTIWIPAFTNLFAISPAGAIKQTFWHEGKAIVSDGRVISAPFYSSSLAIAADGTVYSTVGDGSNGRVLACKLAGETVVKLWEYDTLAYSWSAPALARDGTIYLSVTEYAAFGGRVLALNPNGSLKWDIRLGGAPSAPIIGQDDRVYVGGSDGRIYAINPDGTFAWSAASDDAGFSTPVLDANGSAYAFGSGNVYAFSKEGNLLTKTNISSKYGGSGNVALSADGMLLVSKNNRTLNAFAVDAGLAKSPWPMLDGGLDHAARSRFTAPTNQDLPTLGTLPDAPIGRAEGTVTLSASATGVGPLGYQWRKDGRDVPGQTNSTLQFTKIALADEGWYSVTVTNNGGRVASPAQRLFVLPNPSFPVVPLSLSGWNVDVIREATPPSAAFAFSDIGVTTNLAWADGSSWFESGFRSSPSNGLPASRRLVSALDSNIVFELQPYKSNNVLKLNQAFPTAALTLSSPSRYRFLSVLATSTLNGGGIGELVVTFSDGSKSAPLPVYAQCWNTPSPRMAAGGFSGFSHYGTSGSIYTDNEFGFGFHQSDYDLSALGLDQKPITALTFTKPGYRGSSPVIMGVFAVSGAAVAPALRESRKTAANEFEFHVDSAPTAFSIESSSDLATWRTAGGLIFSADQSVITDGGLGSTPQKFFRLSYTPD